jgi:hypothetical protein
MPSGWPRRACAEGVRGGMQATPVLESALTCPHCGAVSLETMPTDACVYFHQCSSCQALLRPKPGDCCVFCSYGSVPCPPVQEARACCGGPAPT